MNTLLAAPAGRNAAIDLLFTQKYAIPAESAPEQETVQTDDESGETGSQSGGFFSNVISTAVDLICRIPLKLRIKKWDKGVMTLVFNGEWRETITEYQSYDTYGDAKSWPTFEKDVRLGLV